MADPSATAFDPSRLNKHTAAQYSSSSEDDDAHYALPGNDAADDDFGEFYPRKRRRVGGNSKEKAALGIFGSDSDDDRPGQRWKSKTLRSKGVSFVSTTVQHGESNDQDDSSEHEDGLGLHPAGPGDGDDDDDDDEDDEDDDDDDDAGNAGVSLGFGSMSRARSRDKAGESQSAKAFEPQPPIATVKTSFGGQSVLGRGFVPSSASIPVLNEQEADGTSPSRNKPQPSAFRHNGKVNAKSFGARMMAKMGYVEGAGLGKEGQGRSAMIEAKQLQQGKGLGYNEGGTDRERDEEKQQARPRGEGVVDSEERKKRRRKVEKKSLNKAGESGASTPRGRKSKYLTAEELKAIAPALPIPDALVPILDMTGPGGKLLTSTSGLMTPRSGEPESAKAEEVRKLARKAKADLLKLFQEWKGVQERKSWLDLEMKEGEQELADAQSDLDRLKSFSTLVADELTGASDWPQVMACLRKAAGLGSFNSETADVAVAAMHPLMKASDWSPLAEPSRFAADLKDVSTLFTGSGLRHGGQSVDKSSSAPAQTQGVYRIHQTATTPYESMMYKVWLPKVLAAMRDWDALRPGPMLSVLEDWSDLLPPFVRAQVLDNVARKLETAVQDWNPRKKRQSHHLPHTWLFPWLQYLPAYHLESKGTGLVANVRRKYRQLIDVWEFERGVVPGLEQWKDVLGDEWRSLMKTHVLPAMGKHLQANFRVDPADQDLYLSVLTDILKWEKIVGSAMMAEVVAQNVFPTWSATLQDWLALEDADLGQVADWYTWWRRELLKDMAKTESIGSELDKGLCVMNLV